MNSQKAAETVTKYLSRTNGLLVRFLGINLPAISADWWEKTVVDKLTYTQSERVRKSNITSLEGLDLAALLRVFDQNWYEISQKCNLSYEDRHFVKEMPSVRNRWAHVSSGGYSADDAYRDFDTIQRFLMIINTDKETIEEIQKVKQGVFNSRKSMNDDEINQMHEEKKVSEEELGNYSKYYDRNIAYRLLKKLRKATRDKPTIIAGPTGAIVSTLGNLLSALDNPATPPPLKALVIGAIGYIILPIDLIPDIMPVVGYTDDLASAAGVVLAVVAYSNFDMKKLDAEIDTEG
jgi:uncharacterized membrane protein YkvA (DUF1232 family)